jgi:hypothetical protein
MAKTPRISRRRHLRHSNYSRVRRDERLLDFWAAEASDLADTATPKTFTAATNDRLTINSHGYSEGEGPFVVSSSDTLPAGLTAGELYWVSVFDANTLTLHRGKREGVSGLRVDITSTGTGTHSIEFAETAEAMFHFQRENKPRAIAAATDVDTLA